MADGGRKRGLWLTVVPFGEKIPLGDLVLGSQQKKKTTKRSSDSAQHRQTL